jgi:hypothetical protein
VSRCSKRQTNNNNQNDKFKSGIHKRLQTTVQALPMAGHWQYLMLNKDMLFAIYCRSCWRPRQRDIHFIALVSK